MTNKRIFYRDLIEHDHVYTDNGEDQIGLMMRSSFTTKVCPFCSETFNEYRHIPEDKSPPDSKILHVIMEPIIVICKKCGWWQTKEEGKLIGANIESKIKNQIVNSAYSYHAVIESIDISSNNIMVEDLRRHLLNNWQDRKLISAGKAESLVKSLLKEHLNCDIFSATANVNEPDGGIDLYVGHENGRVKSAVQVKRRITKETESVSEVRNFVGALVIENLKKGIFVTTAEKYSSVAKKIPDKLNNRLELELIDGNELFEILKCYTKPEELIIPPKVNSKSIWVDKDGNELNTIQVIYGD